MKWALYDFKTAKEPWFDEAEKIYQKKIKPYAGFELIHLKTLTAGRDEAVLKKNFEAKVLLEKLSSDDYIILLDEKGKKYNSIEFSKLVSTIQESGKKRGVFIIGGAYGVNDEIKKCCQKTICLSDMTMNHLVAELMLLEQFYRALTIINRIPYHNK
ncbi:MAG: 23S rRNA (pseudouridine(1915)-N(3))-methyltransferase RlmH [Bdellovibrionota bacterium]